MFTVLYREANGTERLYEAQTVSRFQTGPDEQSIPAQGMVQLTGVEPSGDNPTDIVVLDLQKPFGAVFVMNRFGTTVARYLA